MLKNVMLYIIRTGNQTYSTWTDNFVVVLVSSESSLPPAVTKNFYTSGLVWSGFQSPHYFVLSNGK